MRQNRMKAKDRSHEPTDRSWFVPKRYGYGATPVRWQGWVLVAVYIAAMLGIGNSGLPLVALVTLLAAATIIFAVITVHNTRGGWRWRWGGRE